GWGSRGVPRGGRERPSERGESSVDQLLLLELVAVRRPRGGAGRFVATGARHGVTAEQAITEAQAQERPRAHVLRLILHPHDAGAGSVGLEQRRELLFREWVQLLEPHDSHVIPAELLPVRDELVVDFSRT